MLETASVLCCFVFHNKRFVGAEGSSISFRSFLRLRFDWNFQSLELSCPGGWFQAVETILVHGYHPKPSWFSGKSTDIILNKVESATRLKP